MTDWQASITDDWPMNGQRLVIYRRQVNAVEVITGFTETGTAELTSIPAGTACEFAGFLLPSGVLEAIAEKVKPGPAAEAARLQEALDIERRRVDNVLDQLLTATAGDEDLELDDDQALDAEQLRAAALTQEWDLRAGDVGDDVDGMSRPSG